MILKCTCILFSFLITVNGNIWQSWTNVDRTTVFTPNSFGYNYVWLSLQRRTGVVFSVKACSDAHIAFSEVIEIHNYPSTEIVIGGWQNSQSVIRRGVGKENYFTLSTPKILHCNEFRTFWVTWKNYYMEVGRGPVFGQQKFLNWQLAKDQFHKVNAMSVATGYGFTGAWRFKQNQASTLYLRTPDDFKYEHGWRTRKRYNYMVFKVRATNDVHIALSSFEGLTKYDTYEVIIGGWHNTKSVIKESVYTSNTIRKEYKKDGLLSGTQYRSFWISWADGTIKVGKGELVGADTFLNWKDPNPHQVKALGFSTGYGASGTWHFNEDLEDRYMFNIRGDKAYNHSWVTMPETKFTTFRVRSCGDAKITLSTFPGQYGEMSTEIVMGADNNRKTTIRRGNQPNVHATFDTFAIVDCQETRMFWISWYNSTIELGRGPVFRQETKVSILAPWVAIFPPRAMGFAQGGNSQQSSNWEIEENTGITMRQTTAAGAPFGKVWYTTFTKQYIIFKVKACSDAEIALSGMPGNPEDQTYEVHIGWGSNSVTMIRLPNTVGAIIEQTPTPNILSCKEYRTFWISWLEGIVKVGRGTSIMSGMVLGMKSPKPHPINALSIRTFQHKGDWIFDQDKGDYIIAYTQDNPNDDHKWITPQSEANIFYFKVKASRDARLLLAESVQNKQNAYVIKLGAMANQRVEIWDLRTEKMEHSELVPNVLDSNTSRPFWVAWNRRTPNTLEVGRGMVYGQNNIMRWDSPQPQFVGAISIATGAGSTGEWKFTRDSGYYILYDTLPQFTYNNLWMTVKHTSHLIFTVYACDNVYLFLTGIINEPSMFAYEIKLSNSRSSISQGHQGMVYFEARTPGILECKIGKSFWVQWFNGQIVVGKGALISDYKSRIMDWQDMHPHPVASISIATDRNQDRAEWNIALDEGAVLPTPPPITQAPGVSGPESGSNKLNPGETAGAVIGFLALFALAGVAVFVIMRPPPRLQKYLGPQVSKQPGIDNPMTATSPTTELPPPMDLSQMPAAASDAGKVF